MISVSLCVDDLEARSDPERSDCIATYEMSEEDKQIVLALIRKYHPYRKEYFKKQVEKK